MSTPVLCAVTGPQETKVVRGLDAAPGLVVARRCADLPELLATAAAGLGRCAVVSLDLAGLDREAVQRVQDAGVRVVLLAAGAGPWSPRAGALGADGVAEDVDDVVAAVDAVLRLRSPEAAAPGTGSAGGTDPATSAVARLMGLGGADGPPLTVTRGAAGALVAVWGPTGAPGRTSVAIGLADELSRDLPGSLLVDADTYGGAVAAVLGLVDEAPGLAAACRAAGSGHLDASHLATLAPGLEDRLRVLTGLNRAERWPEVGAATLEVVWQAARDLAPAVVVDCGFCLEQDEVLSYDTRAPARNGATLSALAEADLVVVVGAADPLGLQRLVRGLQELTALGVPSSRRLVVLNRVRASSAGPRPGAAVREAVQRYAGVDEVVLVPDDRPALDAAALAGRTLAEQAPSSPARRAHQALAVAVATRLGLTGPARDVPRDRRRAGRVRRRALAPSVPLGAH